MPGASQANLVMPVSVATNAELSLVQGGGVPFTGAEIWHTGLQKFFQYFPSDTKTPDGTNVIAALGGGNWIALTSGIIQTLYAEISANTSVGSGSGFVDLLTINITTTGNPVEVLFTFSCDNDTANDAVGFQLLVDGGTTTPSAQARVTSVTGAQKQSGAISKRVTGLAAGAHVLKIQFAALGGGNATINPAANEAAAFTVRELK